MEPLANGPLVILNNVGQQIFVCTRYSTGTFEITFISPHPSGSYPSVQITPGRKGFAAYDWAGPTRLALTFYGTNGVLADPEIEFSFMTVP